MAQWLGAQQLPALFLLAPAAAVLFWCERTTIRTVMRGTDLISGAAEVLGG